jgi:hypothetical protein
MCQKTIIAQKSEIVITQCTNCKTVNIWKTGLLMRFSFEQFDEFAHIAKQIEFDDYLEHAPNGDEVVILSTPCADICLMFTRAELANFAVTLDEAIYMRKVYGLVHF